MDAWQSRWVGGAAGAVLMMAIHDPAAHAAGRDAPLPEGVKAVWDMGKASREATPTRERIWLNGLWRWQPDDGRTGRVPDGAWGYFKVPGCWPGITDYMQKDSQTVFAHPDWKVREFGEIHAAWYQREMVIPAGWAGRRIAVSIESLNSYAAVFVDGKRVGEIRFPAGDLDLTPACKPGTTQRLSLQVIAMPLKGIGLSYTDSAAAREVKGSVPRRGICGDVSLFSEPAGARLGVPHVLPSVRSRTITVGAAVGHLDATARYVLRARITADGHAVKEFTSPTFQAGDVGSGNFEFTSAWMPDALWDIHTPQNHFALELSLLDATGRVLDTAWTTRFGFRELWFDGRDIFLNGTRIHLRAVPFDNAQLSAAMATYGAAHESFERLKAIGINFVYTHHYDCEPGSHLSVEEILRAADDVGMLVALTQPHLSSYEWKAPDADAANGYARDAAFCVREAGAHPSVVMYSTSHNATGYEEDMNPDLIDGVHAPRDTWSARNAALALRAEAIITRLDPGRVVYHHASGNLGSMHAINFYPNMVPIQELSDWFEHWATEGVKPVFMCEFGAPFTWDWTMYRGWYRGEREFGSAEVPWEFCLAEWNAQFLGDRAYAISEAEKTNLRWEARKFHDGALWHRWDYPVDVSSTRLDERFPIFAMYLKDTWRAFRAWGVSAISPWEYGHYWKRREGVDTARKELPVDWDALQRPGFSPDYVDQPMERMDVAFERSDWEPTAAAVELMRDNQPRLAFLAGKPAAITSKDHTFLPGEAIEKQLIAINDSREPATCECDWSLDLPEAVTGRTAIAVAPGAQERHALRFTLPENLPPGRYGLTVHFKFGGDPLQTDRFPIDVLPLLRPPTMDGRIAVFDPRGTSRALLEGIGIHAAPVDADADLSSVDILIIGREALTPEGPAPDITRVRDGLKVIVFEQTSAVLEKRLGFRVAEYGLRQAFPRVSDHPALAGLTADHFRDWRGEATILPPRLTYELRPRYGPTVRWCDIPVPRLWRCGNRGNVASVLIERPARGDFLSIVDGGFGLQYSALMEYREGRGLVVFCQADVTGRTESDPAGDRLVRHLLEHVATWKPPPRRHAVYAGEPAGKAHLEAAGVAVGAANPATLSADDVLVLGPGAARELAGSATAVAAWVGSGGNALALGIDQADADALLPFKVTLPPGEHIGASFDPPGFRSLLAGVGPGDVHNRDPRSMPLVGTGARIVGDGVLATADGASVAFCQLVPWQFDGPQPNLRRTKRRASALVSRLLGNLGVAGTTPLLERLHRPVATAGPNPDQRWLTGLYLDQPEEWDDPYRFFRW